MTVSLLRTKIYIPPTRPDLVPRPRLIQRLNEGLNRKLTLISAPAGYGKTTLLSEWVHQTDLNVAWLSLDTEDNDPARFLAYVIAALQTIPGLQEEKLGGSIPASAESLPPQGIQAVLTALINDITEFCSHRPRQPCVLVLDDYHVIEAPVTDQALTFLLDHMPPPPRGLHLIITGAELYQPYRRGGGGGKLFFGFFGNVGAVVEFGAFLGELHGKGQTSRHAALFAVGFW